MRQKVWLLAGAIVLGIGLLIGALQPTSVRQPRRHIVHATRTTFEQQVLASGTLTLSEQVNVGAQVNGQIKALYVKPGDRVKKGDLLVEIDPVLQMNGLRKAQASLSGLDAQIRLKQQQIKYEATELKRQKQIFKMDGVAQADVDSAFMKLETTRQELEVLNNQRQQLLLEVDSAQVNINYTRITAPVDGVVLHLVARIGQTIVSAQASPVLMVLGDINRLVVKAKISEVDITRVKIGQPVWFTISASSDKKYFSKLESIEALPDNMTSQSLTASPETKTGGDPIYYNGIFHIDNPDGVLRPAMNTQVRIIIHSAKDALIIPIQALGKRLRLQYYQVQVQVQVGNGKTQVVSREIRVGAIAGNTIQVLDGLAEGESLIIPESL
ncbi:efflux RND transporter periplasmic adaptor subunit [Brucella pituitosa]|uniref:Efflux RND transporter periplasmic adaptor subunit n=1 Tax=Brucella pituitosa TaxID=571256 RepID=A0ABS3K8B9_9HYPH|nr:efflux RND transporter periplasmic adaptor subunit [Brucella pituitosa]MBO1042288.1 efflux RND transporter periplasmic adaptor subunit [Brucella pituitosa]